MRGGIIKDMLMREGGTRERDMDSSGLCNNLDDWLQLDGLIFDPLGQSGDDKCIYRGGSGSLLKPRYQRSHLFFILDLSSLDFL